MYHPIVKEQVLPGQLEELQTNPHPTETGFQSQALILGKKYARLWEEGFEGKLTMRIAISVRKAAKSAAALRTRMTVLAPGRNRATICFE